MHKFVSATGFHTYHRTCHYHLKTTVAGMLGAALGIPPKEVNDKWLKNMFSDGNCWVG
ncbi:MAG: hypothetical protein IPO37_25640 [Saprospiraceae bacterium]|nr:hypothetical protein [Saprospiraceae bacterium]